MPRFFAESIVPSSGGGSLAVSLTVNMSMKIKIIQNDYLLFNFLYQLLNLLVYQKINVYLISKKLNFYLKKKN